MSVVSWLPRIESEGGPKYLAIADALLADIQSGRLKHGHRLPSQRTLAKELGVDLTTVTRAFNEARRQGLIEANTGKGSFVRARTAEQDGLAPTASPIIDLSMNMPPQPPEARLRERIQSGIANVLSTPHGLMHLHYQESAGAGPDRAAGARWLERRLGSVPVDRVMVVGGAQTALYAILRTLFQPGDALCAPFLTYPGLRAIAEQLKLRLVPVALDAEGLDPAAFEEICQRDKPRALYCVPTIHNPTTATMPLERREEVARIARRYRVSIIEDDAYGALPRAAPAPIASLAPDITWHIATLSKCVTPAMRTAYVVTPGFADTLRLAAEIRAMTFMVPPLMAALASQWILDGTLDATTAAIREESAARQVIARRSLHGLDFLAHPEGHHLWLTLPERWRQADLNIYARQSGLALVPSDAFAAGPGPAAIRVSLGAAPNRSVLERGLELLATVLSHGPSALSSIV
ncbi:aminotransferase-like domain-containing protein [Microvirga alba]|uniref:8-amino-7-oxononanoate synthase n=1 Tax=Microvirga alba TaxID=2791025 RepID=A0A931BR02_9HYPH|nr:PLP-dependent aminotransferase family protein [Microvirga alba]MBF9234433.1 PLP-dependent aminotransferase family protein [Microvirga alba]